MAKNVGKVFENNWKKSISDNCLLIRIPDPPQSFTMRSDTKFSVKNPFDFIMFDTIHRTLFALELKTTKYKSISFDRPSDIDNSNSKMIHKHQILGLEKVSRYNNVQSGFIFNFRDEKNNSERTYFQNISDFIKMINGLEKTSFNEMDLLLNGGKKINGTRKRVNYKWDVDSFLNELHSENGGN